MQHILVLPRNDIPLKILQNGFTPMDETIFHGLLSHSNLHFMERQAAESNPAFKQLIPYVIFQWQKKYFNYRRGKSGSETRLRELRSLGVGGHIDHTDNSISNSLYLAGLWREMREEVGLEESPSLKTIGFINDDSNDVGKVHLGIVHLIELEEPGLFSRESHLQDCCFSLLSELLRNKDSFETWSQLILPHLQNNKD